MNWLKLTAPQAAALAALNASNPGPNFLSPVADKNGVYWLAADVKSDLRTYAYYAAWLATLTATSEQPVWPAGSAE